MGMYMNIANIQIYIHLSLSTLVLSSVMYNIHVYLYIQNQTELYTNPTISTLKIKPNPKMNSRETSYVRVFSVPVKVI